MKILKKIGKFLINNILLILVFVLLFSITLNKVITKDLLTNFLVEKISNETTEVLDKNFNELKKKDINKINSDIKNNKTINNVIEKYAKDTIDIMTSNKKHSINLTDDAKKIVKNNKNILEEEYNIKVSDKEIDKAMDKLEEDYKLNDYYNNLVKDTSKNLSKEQRNALKIYKSITSTNFVIITSILIIMVLTIIAIYKKSFYKWLKNLSISGIISSIANIIFFAVLTIIINMSLPNFKLQMMKSIEIPLYFLIGSIIVLIIYKIIDKRVSNTNK